MYRGARFDKVRLFSTFAFGLISRTASATEGVEIRAEFGEVVG
jgi:hypothetical protein